jgi:hypothetical protein
MLFRQRVQTVTHLVNACLRPLFEPGSLQRVYLGDGLLLQNRQYTGAADKAVNLVGCKSPHHQLPGRVVSISDACGGNDACSART